MPPASVNSHIGQQFLVLDTVDSTNNYAMRQVHEGLANHGQAYFARHQFAGKGQRGKTWNAAAGENITMSVILDAHYPRNAYPFLLSAAVALASYDVLNPLTGGHVKIKWPNDIYWCDRKAGGILIENIYHSKEWKYAIAGTGLNINQSEFNEQPNKAVSLFQITGRKYDTLEVAKQLCNYLDFRYSQLSNGHAELIIEQYNKVLYKKNEVVRLKKGNASFETTIRHVSMTGQLHTTDVMERTFEFGEVEWIVF